MAKHPTFNQLEWRRSRPSYSWKRKPRAWIGWDTETCKGDIGLVSMDPQPIDSVPQPLQDELKEGYDGGIERYESWNPEDVVDSREILQRMFHPGYHGVWWNLKYDIECILKRLPKNLIKALLKDQDIRYAGYVLSYIPGKKFSIKDSATNRYSHHFDFAQFYHTSLEEAAKRFLDEKKKKESFTRRQLGESWDIWKERKEEIIEYCRHDCYLTRKLAQLWIDWADDFGIDARYPISPANVAGLHAMKKGVPEYSENFHNLVGEPAWKCFFGGRFEARMKGFFNELWNIDIKSAYPSIMVNLPSTECGFSQTQDEEDVLNHPWGFAKAKVFVDYDIDWAPLMHRMQDGLVFSPVGDLGTRWMTKKEYELCKNLDEVEVQFKKGWAGNDDGERPFGWIEDLYQERAQLKEIGDPRQVVLKIAMNSVFGKTVQKNQIHEPMELEDWTGQIKDSDNIILVDGQPYEIEKKKYKVGPLFNPIYGSIITARTRCEIFRMAQEYETQMMMTDGLLISEKPKKKHLGQNLGDWEIDGHGKSVIIGNGLYQIENKIKFRGFNVPKRFDSWFSELDTCPPDAESTMINQRRPLHPGEVLIRNDYDLTKIGEFVDMPKSIYFNHDRKRKFPHVTAQDLLQDNFEGKPLTLGEAK